MSELYEKFKKATENDKSKAFMDNIINVLCLIIDAGGYCNRFSELDTNIFFQILDRRYGKRKDSTVFTSNKMPNKIRRKLDTESVWVGLDSIYRKCMKQRRDK